MYRAQREYQQKIQAQDNDHNPLLSKLVQPAKKLFDRDDWKKREQEITRKLKAKQAQLDKKKQEGKSEQNALVLQTDNEQAQPKTKREKKAQEKQIKQKFLLLNNDGYDTNRSCYPFAHKVGYRGPNTDEETDIDEPQEQKTNITIGRPG